MSVEITRYRNNTIGCDYMVIEDHFSRILLWDDQITYVDFIENISLPRNWLVV